MKTAFHVYSVQQDAEDFMTLMRGQGYKVSIVETAKAPVVRFPDAAHAGNMVFADIVDAPKYWVVHAVK